MRGQEFFAGMEPPAPTPRAPMTKDVYNSYSAEHRSKSETVRRVTAVGPRGGKAAQGRVGLRGSIPERLAMSHRLDRKAAGQARWETMRERMRDEDVGTDYMDEEPEKHPSTGLPSWGSLSTHRDFEGEPAVGFEHGAVPHALSYHGSAPSARRRAGSTEWVPVPGLRTGQPTVSAGRVHQAMESPETTSSPRLPHKELPHVYEATGQRVGERTYTMIDGNHRAASHILSGRLFMEANVLRDKDIPEVAHGTRRIEQAKFVAQHNPKVDQSEVENRLNRNLYGDDY